MMRIKITAIAQETPLPIFKNGARERVIGSCTMTVAKCQRVELNPKDNAERENDNAFNGFEIPIINFGGDPKTWPKVGDMFELLPVPV